MGFGNGINLNMLDNNNSMRDGKYAVEDWINRLFVRMHT